MRRGRGFGYQLLSLQASAVFVAPRLCSAHRFVLIIGGDRIPTRNNTSSHSFVLKITALSSDVFLAVQIMRPKKLSAVSLKVCIKQLIQCNDSLLSGLPNHIKRMLVRDAQRVVSAFYIDVTSRRTSSNLWMDSKYEHLTEGRIYEFVPDNLKTFSAVSAARERIWRSARKTMKSIIYLQQQELCLSVAINPTNK